jgi:hypothetical protein
MKRQPGKGSFARCVEKVSKRGGVDDPRAVCAAAKMKAGEKLNRRNPIDLAAEAFEKTHGYAPDESVVFHEKEHYHEYLPAWGELIELLILPEGETRAVQLLNFDGAMLAFSEHDDLPQLEIVGGDQSIDANTLYNRFNVERMHEKVTLGKCVDIVYFTVKTHLGKDGGEADYHHKFAEESGKRKLHVRIVKSPLATYHTLNRKIELWGGVYENTPEGIRD